jgi:hypothetical protein
VLIVVANDQFVNFTFNNIPTFRHASRRGQGAVHAAQISLPQP